MTKESIGETNSYKNQLRARTNPLSNRKRNAIQVKGEYKKFGKAAARKKVVVSRKYQAHSLQNKAVT
jgi:hypothetical protein